MESSLQMMSLGIRDTLGINCSVYLAVEQTVGWCQPFQISLSAYIPLSFSHSHYK